MGIDVTGIVNSDIKLDESIETVHSTFLLV